MNEVKVALTVEIPWITIIFQFHKVLCCTWQRPMVCGSTCLYITLLLYHYLLLTSAHLYCYRYISKVVSAMILQLCFELVCEWVYKRYPDTVLALLVTGVTSAYNSAWYNREEGQHAFLFKMYYIIWDSLNIVWFCILYMRIHTIWLYDCFSCLICSRREWGIPIICV